MENGVNLKTVRICINLLRIISKYHRQVCLLNTIDSLQKLLKSEQEKRPLVKKA